MEQIQALRFDVDEVGKHVKGSKKRYCWEIALKDKAHSIVLDFSFISGKVKITVDRKILLENELPADVSFQYPFTLDGFALNIIQQGESFELRINNKVFSHLYTQQKTNTEFKKYEDEVKDIKVDIAQLNPQKQKISLNIGAFGPAGMKKKKDAGEAQSWNAFAGGSFPNYFGETVPQNAQKPKPSPNKSNLLDQQEEVAVKTANEFNIIQAQTVKVQQKKSEDLFDMASSQPTREPVSNPQEFSNMQDMFNSLSLNGNNSNPNPNNNELDFFAEPSSSILKQPKKEEVPQPVMANNSFDFGPSPTIGLTGFATGFGMQQHSQLNPKSFTTMTNSSKGFDLSSLDLSVSAPKQEPIPSFAKKPSQQNSGYSQMEQIFTSNINQSNLVPPTQSNPPQVSDFNTMQNLFQTSGLGNPQDFGFSQPPQKQQFTAGQVTQQFGFSQVPQKQQFATGQVQQQQQQFDFNQFQSNKVDFNSMQLLFQTNSANQGFAQPNPNPTPVLSSNPLIDSQPQVQKPNPLDMFSQNKPASFATMSGGNFSQNFDMSHFGTMQPNAGGSLQVNFFESKPSSKPSPSGDLI